LAGQTAKQLNNAITKKTRRIRIEPTTSILDLFLSPGQAVPHHSSARSPFRPFAAASD
jgi:hypothetical protein